MNTENNQPLTETALPADEVKLWSVLAQLSFLVGYAIPFGGVIAAALIFTIIGKKDAVVKENARAALNLAISGFVVWAIGMVAIITVVGAPFGLAAIVFYGLYSVIASVLNAFAIKRGEMASYKWSTNFI